MMEQRFFQLVQKKGYFKYHRRILLAISGGLDSMTLFDWLYKYREKLEVEILLAHINHGVRKESDFEEEELKKIAKKLGVKIFTSSFSGPFSEQKARDFRYTFFKKIMKEEQCTALVTAHHADDQAETIFMRILRGSRLFHISGMKEKQKFANGELIRPLLSFQKSDFPTIFHFEDWTNQENHYLRNRIRNDYFPILEKENSQLKKHLIELGTEISQMQDALAYLTKNIELTNVKEFQYQPYCVQSFLLQTYLKKFPDLQVSKAQFADLLIILNKKSNYSQLIKSDYELYKNYDYFEIRKISPQSDLKEDSILLKYNDIVEYGHYRFSFGKELRGKEIQEVFVSRETEVLLRHRKEQDEIILNQHHKKLRRYFINQKIPIDQRKNAIIIEQNGKILAIAGIVTSDLSKSQKNDIMYNKLYIQNLDR